MKTIDKILIVATMGSLAACNSSDTEDLVTTEEELQWTVCNLEMNVEKPSFGDNSRAEDYQWADGARIYISFDKKDGSTTYGSALYSKSDGKWSLSYNGRLDNGEYTCRVYYFEGSYTDDAIHVMVTTSTETGIYVDDDALYEFSDRSVSLSARLQPFTSRIRFKRNNSSGSLTGYAKNMVTYSSFDLNTCQFVQNSPQSEIKVTFKNGEYYSNYIYASHVNYSEDDELSRLQNDLKVRDSAYVYRYEFPEKSDFLKIGESGYMNWPTSDSHNGWYAYNYISPKKICNMSSAGYSDSPSIKYEQVAAKNDLLIIGLGNSNNFYPKQTNSYFKLYVDGLPILNLRYADSTPGVWGNINYDSAYLTYHVLPDDGTYDISYYCNYWYMYSSYNFIYYTNF